MNKFYKAINVSIIVVISLFLISAPIYWVSLNGGWQTTSEIEYRELNVFPSLNFTDFKLGVKRLLQFRTDNANNIFFGQFLIQSFQEQVDNAAVDQFPLRLVLTKFEKSVERAQISLAYAFLDDPAKPASLDSQYLIMRDEPVFVQAPSNFDDSMKNVINSRIRNYQDLIDQFPENNFSIFYVERIPFAPFHPMVNYFPEADKGDSFAYFLANKPEELNVSALQFSDFEEYQKYFFRTDHHWNIRGAWQAYQIIYAMLAEHYVGISPKLELGQFVTIDSVEFCGSNARNTLYPCKPEEFEYAEVNLPEFYTVVDGVKQPYGKKEEYLKGEFNRNLYTNHYGEFFGSPREMVEYHFENNNGRNLLIIGTSYSHAMQVYVASHYHDTYKIDLRKYGEFSLGEMIEKYDINDILVLGDTITYGRKGWMTNP